MDYRDGLTALESRAKLATVGLWIFVLLAALTAVAQIFEASGLVNLDTDYGPLAAFVGFAYVAYFAILVGCVIMTSRWIYRAHANLVAADVQGLEFTPGWAVGWYFIPFMNLIKPYQAMRELWAASHSDVDRFGDEGPSDLKVWWGAWIVGNILDTVSTRIALSGGEDGIVVGNIVGAVSEAPIIVAALFLMKIITQVTQAQRSGGSAVAVFA